MKLAPQLVPADWQAKFGLESLEEKALVCGSRPDFRGGELDPNWIHDKVLECFEQTFTQKKGPPVLCEPSCTLL